MLLTRYDPQMDEWLVVDTDNHNKTVGRVAKLGYSNLFIAYSYFTFPPIYLGKADNLDAALSLVSNYAQNRL